MLVLLSMAVSGIVSCDVLRDNEVLVLKVLSAGEFYTFLNTKSNSYKNSFRSDNPTCSLWDLRRAADESSLQHQLLFFEKESEN